MFSFAISFRFSSLAIYINHSFLLNWGLKLILTNITSAYMCNIDNYYHRPILMLRMERVISFLLKSIAIGGVPKYAGKVIVHGFPFPYKCT